MSSKAAEYSSAQLYESLQPISIYYDRQSHLSKEEYMQKLANSCTLYVGNLSIYTTEEQIFELFNRIGAGVKRLIMGRNKETGQAIGFCFIEYHCHENAGVAVEYLNYLKLDGRVIRVDWDIGYSEGREFGRGSGGYQVRDTYRKEVDPERPNVQNKQMARGRGRQYGKRAENSDSNDDSESDEDKRRKKVKKQYGQRRR